jgi:hypothetical protein
MFLSGLYSLMSKVKRGAILEGLINFQSFNWEKLVYESYVASVFLLSCLNL